MQNVTRTSDRVDVVHARWKVFGRVIYCSRCGRTAAQRVTLDLNDGPIYGIEFDRTPFCPYCGAKMNKEENTNG